MNFKAGNQTLTSSHQGSVQTSRFDGHHQLSFRDNNIDERNFGTN